MPNLSCLACRAAGPVGRSDGERYDVDLMCQCSHVAVPCIRAAAVLVAGTAGKASKYGSKT